MLEICQSMTQSMSRGTWPHWCSLWVLRKLCSILCIISYIVTPRKSCLITYSREELLDIRAKSTYQHYDQEYDFPEVDPLLDHHPGQWILSQKPTQNNGATEGADGAASWSGSVDVHISHRSRVYYSPISSLDNKVDEIRERVAFQRDNRDCNVLCFMETWLSRDMLSESVQPSGFSMHHVNRDKHLSWKRKGGVYASWLMTQGVIITAYRNSSPSAHPT